MSGVNARTTSANAVASPSLNLRNVATASVTGPVGEVRKAVDIGTIFLLDRNCSDHLRATFSCRAPCPVLQHVTEMGHPQQAQDPRVGSIIGQRYHLLEVIGHGGMGAVFQAEHVMMRKTVAIKLLHPELGRIDEVAR